MSHVIRLLGYAKHRTGRLLDRVSERGVPQLMATSLALLALFDAGALLLFTDRFYDAVTFSTVFMVAHPAVWGGLYALTGAVLLVGSARDRAFTMGASLALCAVHAFIGVLTIYPIVGADGLPTGFSRYMGFAVFCYINYLMWRSRKARPCPTGR